MFPRHASWRFPGVKSWVMITSIAVGLGRGSPEFMPSLSMAEKSGGDSQTTALLLALPVGSAGEENILEWAAYVRSEVVELPPIWVVCPGCSNVTAMVQDHAPHFQPFVVDDSVSWGKVLRRFLHQVSNTSSSAALKLTAFTIQRRSQYGRSVKHVGGEYIAWTFDAEFFRFSVFKVGPLVYITDPTTVERRRCAIGPTV